MQNNEISLRDFEEESIDSSKEMEGIQQSETTKPPQNPKELETIFEIPVTLAAVLGEMEMSVRELLALQVGSVISLHRKVGEPIDVHLNDRLVARGEVSVVDDKLGITMTEIIKKEV